MTDDLPIPDGPDGIDIEHLRLDHLRRSATDDVTTERLRLTWTDAPDGIDSDGTRDVNSVSVGCPACQKNVVARIVARIGGLVYRCPCGHEGTLNATTLVRQGSLTTGTWEPYR